MKSLILNNFPNEYDCNDQMCLKLACSSRKVLENQSKACETVADLKEYLRLRMGL